MLRIATAIIALCVVSCSSSQEFQRSVNNSDGHTITDRAKRDQFTVKIIGKKPLKEISLNKYMSRAVGEECDARGFKYYDIAWINSSSAAGYCYKTQDALALSLEFKAEPLKENPPRLIISKVNGKGHSRLSPEDELIAVNDKEVKSLDDLKLIENELSEKEANVTKEDSQKLKEPREKRFSTAKVTIIRLGEKMTVIEPYVHINQGISGPDDLKKLKSEIFWNED